jgi:hypothetical protein
MRPPVSRRFCLALILAAVLFGASLVLSPFNVTSHAQIAPEYPPLPPCGFGVLVSEFDFLDNHYIAITVTIDCGGGDVCSASALICSCGRVTFDTDC